MKENMKISIFWADKGGMSKLTYGSKNYDVQWVGGDVWRLLCRLYINKLPLVSMGDNQPCQAYTDEEWGPLIDVINNLISNISRIEKIKDSAELIIYASSGQTLIFQ